MFSGIDGYENHHKGDRIYVDGDIIIGALFPVHHRAQVGASSLNYDEMLRTEAKVSCITLRFRSYKPPGFNQRLLKDLLVASQRDDLLVSHQRITATCQ